jgi:hypothetical protein
MNIKLVESIFQVVLSLYEIDLIEQKLSNME